MLKKAIVETVGPYMYIDTHTGFVIESDRAVVAPVTPFLSQKIADGIINLLVPNLPVEADDKEFLEYLNEFKDSENATNNAVAAYISQFGIDESGRPTGQIVTPKKNMIQKSDEELEAEEAAKEAEEAAAKEAEEAAAKEAEEAAAKEAAAKEAVKADKKNNKNK